MYFQQHIGILYKNTYFPIQGPQKLTMWCFGGLDFEVHMSTYWDLTQKYPISISKALKNS